jgi:5-methyltetrahydropteroyltriglutamate--homocysteine methyltransferase
MSPSHRADRVGYRADQVGSLLRPPELLEAREERAAGRITAERLREIENRAILDVLELQRSTGIEVLTDGEYRRSGWMGDMAEAVAGFVPGGFSLPQQSEGESWQTSAVLAVGERLRQHHRLTSHESGFLLRHAGGPCKITIPSPTNFAYLCFQPGLSDRCYRDSSELLEHLVEITRAELEAVVEDGVPYVQLDAPRYTLHVDPTLRKTVVGYGIDMDRALDESIAADNACLAAVDRSRATVAMHLCRGNSAGGAWYASGGYDAIAEKLFGGLDVDRFLLEYDSERSGGFEPLRFVPPQTTVVLGLITTKSPRLESIDDLLRRIDEASRMVPLERLAVSPQCGFASVAPGNPLTRDDMRRKLELVVEVARRVWK